ncbi:toll/interleukin-1 receptor domain-containing protein [Dactylosporangium sp. NPDC000521]|uniref:toll/interleukin-1 receptor domain-containing protein n=1 Tax=Dactylosporangium sp. NPDC000521 TaxID=3363975 RepID=UPI0036A4637F
MSYRRANAWPRFVSETFLPMFRHWLGAELDASPRIFFDADVIETGDSWPHKLAEGIAGSKLLMCLWSREYFSSEWCLAELGHMLARREAVGNGRGAPPPLVVAAVIHDGDDLPTQLRDIQRYDIQQYANPWLAAGSPTAEELSNRVRVLAAHVANALRQTPEHDAGWSGLATEQFIELHRRRTLQRTVPSLGGDPA